MTKQGYSRNYGPFVGSVEAALDYAHMFEDQKTIDALTPLIPILKDADEHIENFNANLVDGD